jgi:hypothetical protein
MWLKLKGYLIAFGVLVAALASAVLYGREKGKQAEAVKTTNAEVKADVATANAAQNEDRHNEDVAVQKLPDAPPQLVATADPATAAGKLRDSGFTRD